MLRSEEWASGVVAEGGRAEKRACADGAADYGGAVGKPVLRTRLRVDPRTRDYYERRSKEGRTRREIVRSLKRYAAREVFHLVRPVQSQPAL
ncbi:hypothetical protein [Streptomyces sp. NPDC003374]